MEFARCFTESELLNDINIIYIAKKNSGTLSWKSIGKTKKYLIYFLLSKQNLTGIRRNMFLINYKVGIYRLEKN